MKFGGLKFLDAAHIKDMLALLRFVENPRDRVADSVCCTCCPASISEAQRVLVRMAEAADPIAALAGIPTPPRAGDDWKVSSRPSAIFDIQKGPSIWNGPAYGTSRI